MKNKEKKVPATEKITKKEVSCEDNRVKLTDEELSSVVAGGDMPPDGGV